MSIRNILSYKSGTVFSGAEILEWIKFHLDNKTSLSKEALRLDCHYGITLNPNHNYSFYRGRERDRGPEVFMIKRIYKSIK